MQTKKFNIKNILSNYALYFIMILMVIVIGSMSPKFFSWRVLRDILVHGNPLQYPCLENPMDGGAW